ncbi:MAG: TonB-dependent receptor, partial [Calditrichaeota bacterium]
MRYERRKSGALTTLLVLIMMLGCISFLTAATTGKIAGKIVDNESGDALPGANVIITGTTMGAATDASGHFFIINVPPGKYSVKASMMGYGAVIKTEVFVTIGHTTPLDFELGMEAIAGEEIVLVAEREIIKKDMSSSVVTSSIEDMQAMPMVSNVGGYANLLAGVDGWNIRGGRADETEFLMDGLLMVDNLGNRALTMPNLTSVEQVNIIKGGFNAEYGNVRSGVVNMVTKKSSFEKYHASAEFRYKPAQMEHRGPSLFSHDTYFLRSYLDETNDLAYLGTQSLPEHLQSEYKPFIGWNQYVENEGKGQTPEQARDMFLWLTRAAGADELLEKYGVTNYDGSPRAVEYSNKPNLMLDATVGGPVPFVKNMSFLASHRNDKQMWVIPAHPYDREAYREHQSQLKLTYKMTENLEVGLDGLYKKVKSISDDQTWAGDPYMYGQTDPVGGAYAQFNRTGTVSTWWGAGNPSFQTNLDLYSPESNIAFDRTSKMMGLSVDHVLSPNTFYNIRVSYISTDNDAPGRYLYNYGNTDNPLEGRYEDYIPDSLRYDLSRDVGTLMRDTTKVIWFGPVGIDMAPYGIVGKSDLYAQSWIQDPPLEIENRGFTFNFSTSK